MNCTCHHCGTVYRVDPHKVPENGVRARCARCSGVFAVPGSTATQAPVEAVSSAASAPAAKPSPEPAPAPQPQPQPAATAAPPVFGAADPHGRARRLARALISDMVVYYPDRRERSLRDGTLRQEFRDEIRKSWDEYVAQVGDEIARGTPYFRDALNEILAGGSAVF